MTWQNSRGKVLAIFLVWLLIAVFWTLVALDVLPTRHHAQGALPWLAMSGFWMAAVLWGLKLRQLATGFRKGSGTKKFD
jgi:hypothetical protein